MKKSHILGLVTSAAMAFQMLSGVSAGAVPSSPESMRDITTMELVRDMGIGINLGNTMESYAPWVDQWGDGTATGYETAWGSPVITKEMIQGMADEGFGVLRIPVAWSNMMSTDGSYTISNVYMARVQELVDWTLETGMYAIVNLHWDGGWLESLPENKDECMKRYTVMWEQICAGFENYGDHLMFESQNEELGWNSVWNQWGGPEGKEESYGLVNEVNQKFVDIVRSSGGNNPQRHLLISGYGTDFNLTCDPMFKMPNDPMNRCAVSVHYYTPAGFAILTEDAEWAKNRTTWGTTEDFAELNQQMNLMKTTFIDKGIPVIIGEYGCPGVAEGKEADSVRLFLSSVCREAYGRQMCPVLWATPGGHYNRDTCQLDDRQLQAEYMEIVGDNVPKPPVTEPTPEPTSEPPVETTEPSTEVSSETVVDPPTPVVGDLNNDGVCSVRDVILLQKFLLGVEPLPAGSAALADCYADGVIDIFDLAMMKRLVLSE